MDGDPLRTKTLPVRWRPTARARRAAALAISIALLLAVPAHAFKQAVGPDHDEACLGTTEFPCIRWRKTSGDLSITIQAFLDSSLNSQEVDLEPHARAAINAFNGLPARNPYIEVTANSGVDEISIKTKDLGDPSFFGSTVHRPDFFSQPATNLIDHAWIRFNAQTTWHNPPDGTIGGSCYTQGSTRICTQDARKVAVHEMGHAQGLAHEVIYQAVMDQGWLTFDELKTDDINGIKHIYGAYP